MSQWGKNDRADNTAIQWVSQVQVTQNTSNRTAFYGNTTPSGFNAGVTKGIFGVDSAEYAINGGNVASYRITSAGSGYSSNAAVTLSVVNGGSGATSNATANSIGRISLVNANQVGSGYIRAPGVAIAAPANTTFNANTGVNGANISFNASSNVASSNDTIILGTGAPAFSVGDLVTYTLATGNTVISGLTANTNYYISFANATQVALSSTLGGANLNLTAGSSETGHYITGPLNYITLSTAGKFVAGDRITYRVGTGNTAISGLTSGVQYWVKTANSTAISLASDLNNSVISLAKGVSETGHALQGETATASAVVSGGENVGASAGWCLRTVGTGGRAGRVQYECLVAMRNITGDGSDDDILPDA